MNTEYWELRALGRNYEDAKKMAVRVSNRIKALERADHLSFAVNAQLDAAQAAKAEAERIMVGQYKKTAPPAIVTFQQSTTGLGAGLMAQLVGCVGDFCTYTEAWWEETSSQQMSDSQLLREDEEASSQARSDSQTAREKRVLKTGDVVACGVRDIWAFCGHGDATRRRRRNAPEEDNFAAGSVLAKTTVHLMADFAVRQNGVPDKNGKPRPQTPYYPLYVQAKADALARHPEWTKGHADNHGLRLVGKAILKDVWRVQHGQEPVYGAQTPWTDRRAA